MTLVRFRQDLYDGKIPIFRHQFKGRRVQIIPHENAGGIAPDVIGGHLSPAHVGMIDDVIMQKGRRMDEFDDGSQRMAPFPLVAAQRRCRKEQQGPKPLSAAADEMMADLGDHRYGREEGLLHANLHLPEIILK